MNAMKPPISQTSKENENWSSITDVQDMLGWVGGGGGVYSEVNLTETTFGLSYAAEVREIRIPLYSTSFEKKKKKQKQ